MRRILLILLPLLVSITAIIIAYNHLRPRLESYVIRQVSEYSKANLPIHIQIQKLQIQLINPYVTAKQIQLIPNQSPSFLSHNAQVESVSVYLDFLALATGRLQISEIEIDNPQVRLNSDYLFSGETKPDQKIDFLKIFEILNDLPITLIELNDSSLFLNQWNQIPQISFEQTLVQLKRSKNRLQLNVDLPELRFEKGKRNDQVRAEAQATLTPQNLEIHYLNLENESSKIQISGLATQVESIHFNPQANLKLDVSLKNQELIQKIQSWSTLKLPAVKGDLRAQGIVQISGLEKISSDFKLALNEIEVDQFRFGSAQIEGSFANKVFKFSELQLHHPAGEAKLNKTEFNLSDMSLSSTLKVETFDFQKLFVSLDLKSIPVFSEARAELPCQAYFKPSFRLNCTGQVNGEYFRLTDSIRSKNQIVAFQNYQINGQVEVNSENVNYKTQLMIGNSRGLSDGIIDYKTGFKINYSTELLDFKNIQNLVNLPFEGQVRLTGSTEGDSQAATMSMNAEAQNFWFANYFLGELKTNLSYQNGILSFIGAQGLVGLTQYQGDLQLNLPQGTVQAVAKSPYLETKDMLQIFSRIVQLPFEVQASGNAEIKVWGPLQFNLLSYDLRTSLFKGSVAGESFDRAFFDVTSRDGEVKTDRAYIQKGTSQINMTGLGHSNGLVEVLIEGQKIKIQDSENINKLSSSLIGNLNFKMTLNGPVLSPDSNIRGTLSEVSIQDQDIENTSFNLTLNRNSIEGQVNIVGGKIFGEFIFPYNETAPFKLDLKANQWDFTAFLSILTAGAVQSDYKSNLTGQINIRSDRGGFWKSTGQIQIDRLFIARDNYSLENPKPMIVQMFDGTIQLEDINLIGPGQSFSIEGKNFTTQNLAMNVKVKSDLKLLQILTPFLEDIGGPVDLTAQVRGELLKPQVLGNLTIQNSYVKIKGFPHPIEKIKSDIIFSHSKILINSIRGQLAGGAISGDGQIQINGFRDVDTKIRAHIEGMSLNVPDKVRTTGSADLLFSGKWFPFILSGTYTVQNGMITMEFDDSSASSGPRTSSYLPQMILQDAFDPIQLDIQVDMSRKVAIKNSLVDGNLTGQLQIKGPPQNPIPIGTIEADANTKLFFRDKLFEVNTMTVNFNEPTQINPEIFVSARSRLEDYDISLLVQGKTKDLQLKLTSVPPLPEQDIISLLALGVTSQKLDQNINSSEQAAQSSYQIGSVILSQNPLNKKLQEQLGVDLQFSSDFDDTKNVAVPKITLSRKITPKLNASASRSFGDESSVRVRLQYSINPNVSAVGSWEGREASENKSVTGNQEIENQSILGLDLEFKREFR